MKKKRPPRCDVALLVDVETGEFGRGGRFVPERDSVEHHVLRVLRRRYRAVDVVPFQSPVAETTRRLRALAPRLVFNLTEWIDGDRRQDATIARMLDKLQLSYTGTGPSGLRLARDKAQASRTVGRLGVPVPSRYSVNGRALPWPVIVKPRYGDASELIGKDAVVGSARELKSRVRAVRRRTRQPAVCEAFVPGRDLYVGLLGNEPRVLKPVELVVGRTHAQAPSIATYRLKNDARYRARWRVHYRRARLDPATARRLAVASRRIFHALELRDYARLDFRLTPDNRIVFIEANPNPDLDPHAMNRSGCFSGVRYERLIDTIVSSALRRGGRSGSAGGREGGRSGKLGRAGERKRGRAKKRK